MIIMEVSDVDTALETMSGSVPREEKLLHCSIISCTEDADTFDKFLTCGGWQILHNWLDAAKENADFELLDSLLQVYHHIPVTVKLLRSTVSAKTIRQLSKSENENIASLASDIVAKWKDKVKIVTGHTASAKAVKKDSSESNGVESARSFDLLNGIMDTSSKGTVKVAPTNFRLTGLEDRTPPTKKAPEKDAPKRPSTTKASSASKKLKVETNSKCSQPSSASPADRPGGVVLISPRPKPVEQFESNLFIDAISSHPVPRKKRKTTKNSEKKTSTNSGAASPQILDSSPTDSPPLKSESLEANDCDKSVDDGIEDPLDPLSELPESTNQISSVEGVLDESLPSDPLPRKKRKSVSWANEMHLQQYFYFELDETERVNVNRIKDIAEMQRLEHETEREAMMLQKGIRKGSDFSRIDWRKPPVLEPMPGALNIKRGCKSQEREIQKRREQSVLQAIYFSKEMVPVSAEEPDAEPYNVEEPKIIPIDDQTNGETTHDHTQVVEVPPPVSLPPELASMLNNLSQQVQNQDMPVPTAVAQQPMPMPVEAPPDWNNQQFDWNQSGMPPFDPSVGPGPMPPTMGPPQMMMPPGYPFPGPRGPPRGPPFWNGPPAMRPPMRARVPTVLCRHFSAATGCHFGNTCRFLHPGVNGPPL